MIIHVVMIVVQRWGFEPEVSVSTKHYRVTNLSAVEQLSLLARSPLAFLDLPLQVRTRYRYMQ